MGKWCVYRHTLPDGRYYIGITSQTPEGRWKNGFGYENQRKFFEEILAFGWNNIRHEIIVSGLDETYFNIAKERIYATERVTESN